MPHLRRPGAGRLAPWLPRGGELSHTEWLLRHRAVCVALAVHVPVVIGYGLATGRSVAAALLASVPTAGLLGLAVVLRGRRSAAFAACAGLLATSAVLVHLAHGATIMHAHYFVAVALCSLYEDWAPYLMTLAVVLGQNAVLGPIAPRVVYGAGGAAAHPARMALVTAAFVAAASGAQLVLWRDGERTRARERRYRRELYEGQESLRAELSRITTTREDLLATVSHEFRTPITAIKGAALTLRKHRPRLSEAKLDELLDAVVANTDRLGRLLENMLTAAEVRQPDHDAVTNVNQVATEAAALVHAAHAQRAPHVVVVIDDDVVAVVERQALHQMLANLLDNAIVHAAPGSQAIVTGVVDGAEVIITVANEAHGVDARTLASLFEPFTQADGSITRPKQGAGVGLYVVRRLIEVSNGSLTVYSQPGWVSVEVRLPAVPAELRRPAAPADTAGTAGTDTASRPRSGDPTALGTPRLSTPAASGRPADRLPG